MIRCLEEGLAKYDEVEASITISGFVADIHINEILGLIELSAFQTKLVYTAHVFETSPGNYAANQLLAHTVYLKGLRTYLQSLQQQLNEGSENLRGLESALDLLPAYARNPALYYTKLMQGVSALLRGTTLKNHLNKCVNDLQQSVEWQVSVKELLQRGRRANSALKEIAPKPVYSAFEELVACQDTLLGVQQTVVQTLRNQIKISERFCAVLYP
ncbi:MAG: hypothetical protein Q7K43_06535 [Candidatus Woesearchaeota archaeon]|nr:hypothetical protein [Candidatus Woesearchaeota archaeon]